MLIRKLILPNGKQVLFLGLQVYQRWSDDEGWGQIDERLLIYITIPGDTQIEETVA